MTDCEDGLAPIEKSGGGGGGGSGGGAAPQLLTALNAFNLPPVMVLPASAATQSVPRREVLSWDTLNVGPHAASTRAATPDTWGVAIDVPLM